MSFPLKLWTECRPVDMDAEEFVEPFGQLDFRLGNVVVVGTMFPIMRASLGDCNDDWTVGIAVLFTAFEIIVHSLPHPSSLRFIAITSSR